MTTTIRIPHTTRPHQVSPPPIPTIRPITNQCLCPGCYWTANEQSELCLRCTLDGCDHEENRHG